MLSETMVLTFLQTSVTGAGLVLAVYALMSPISEKIFNQRAKKIQVLLREFEKEKQRIAKEVQEIMETRGRRVTVVETYDLIKRHVKAPSKLGRINVFPPYLGLGATVTFVLFIFSAFLDLFYLLGSYDFPVNYIVVLSFILSMLSFFMVGIIVIHNVFEVMKTESEDIRKKKGGAQKYYPVLSEKE